MVRPALFRLGFRPFFLGAAIFALLSMALWMAVYAGKLALPLTQFAPSQWHAHEMLYGYAMAVIAGFLLTAIRNWTDLPTPTGGALAALFLPWLGARIALVFGERFLAVAAVLDIAFALALIVACARPIVHRRQWRQAAVISKLVLLGAGNALFYAGAIIGIENGVHWSIHGGLYLVVALILTMGRRLIPFFTERGIPGGAPMRNSLALDMTSLVFVLGFWILEVFLQYRVAAAVCCAVLVPVNIVRQVFWYHRGILARPLLWSLHLSFALLNAGFLLYALAVWLALPLALAVHAFAIGGIGLITVSMVMRVSIGHTGRNVHEPPRLVLVPITLIVLAWALRVLLPLAWPALYVTAVQLSQLAWIVAFSALAILLWPLLTRPRPDGGPL